MANTNKKCSRCKMTFSITMFYSDRTRPSGKRNNCKSCSKIQDATYYATIKGKQIKSEAAKRYSQTLAGKLCGRRKSKKKARLYPDRERAKHAVAYAIRAGTLLQATKKLCYVCKKPAIDHHHYKGYAKENGLAVLPMCRQCHISLHKQERED